MRRYLWNKIEAYIQAAITERLLLFYQRMIERKQISEIAEDLPSAD